MAMFTPTPPVSILVLLINVFLNTVNLMPYDITDLI